MKVKVCGMRDPENVRVVAGLEPDMMGFIFHPSSPRFVSDPAGSRVLDAFPKTKRVGIFVDVELDEVLAKLDEYALDMVQLHGNESPGFCATLSGFVPVAKAFRVGEGFDFAKTYGYDAACDLFVFDARGAAPGGNGIKFNWGQLEEYAGKTPFLLSGGIGPGDAAAVLAFEHEQFAGVDLNSAFESAPGMKDAGLLEGLFKELGHLQVEKHRN